MNSKKKNSVPDITILIPACLILILVILITHPQMLFFLNDTQRYALMRFNQTYITSKNPVSDSEGLLSGLRFSALAIVILSAWGVTQVLKYINSAIKVSNRRATTIKGLAFNCLNYVIVIYAAIYCLSIMGVNMVAIIASIGVLSLVIGFGAQRLIEDVITGLFIVFEGQFQVGDIVAIDGWRGTVTNIGIRTTQITDAGGNTRVLNNSDIRTVTNLSNVSSVAIADISIAYSADLREAETVIERCLWTLPRVYPNLFKEKPKCLGVESLNDSSITLRVIATVEESNVYNARRTLNRELKLALDAGGIEIPFPQIVVHNPKK